MLMLFPIPTPYFFPSLPTPACLTSLLLLLPGLCWEVLPSLGRLPTPSCHAYALSREGHGCTHLFFLREATLA